jgi:glucose/arabinose dehydrogenase/mono/diheme cytochrome c family protein
MQINLASIARRTKRTRVLAFGLTIGAGFFASALSAAPAAPAHKESAGACPSNDSGLKLPAGFCASVFADGIGHARHMVVSESGVVYVNTWSGEYYGNDTPHEGGFLVALKDTSGKGRASVIERFGETVKSGGAGGTGIGIFKDWLYAEINDKIVRYRLDPRTVSPKGAPETIVSGLPLGGDHPMHPFMIDAAGNMYVDVATATNSCQPLNRSLESPGSKPCTELKTRGGVWLYDANKTGQKFSPAERFATGIRNAEGIAEDAKGNLYATQHGRDQLHSNWPNLYALEQEATLPAEELMHLTRGGDYGWPECYYDPKMSKLVLAPEYGGDAKKSGECADKSGPVAAFPAHWAPDGMAYYDKASFPQSYRNGVYIAFHGSWNRAPYPQRGYLVAFQALNPDANAGRCEIFADGFAGAELSPEKAEHRPTGVTVGPDGSLYVSDDVRGRIYRITYQGGGSGGPKPVACPDPNQSAGEIVVAPETADSAGGRAPTDSANLPVADGATREMVLTGDKLFHGQIAGASCTGCHGAGATGTPLGPNLTRNRWYWSDGTWAGIAATIRSGVPQPKNYRSPMPAMGGASLTSEQVNSIAAYVWGLSNARPAPSSPPKAEIHISGERVFPESITSTADDRLIIGSIGKQEIYTVDAGSDVTRPWIHASVPAALGVLGVYADDRTQLLWACWSEVPGLSGPKMPSTLVSYDLRTGTEKSRYLMPTANALCNDVASTADGSVYVTDSNNMEIDWLPKGSGSLKLWAGQGAFGAKGGVLDGIALVGKSIYVNTLATNKVFRVPVASNGDAGVPAEVTLDRPILGPDGMRSFGKSSVLLAEGGGAGRLSRIDLNGTQGKVTVLKEGFPGGPVSVAVIGQTGYVLEGQLAALFDSKAKMKPLMPFHAIAVPVGVAP